MRRITITFDTGRGFTVSESGRHADRMAWDEMLGQVAALTHPKLGTAHYPMLTPEEMRAYETKYHFEPDMMTKFDAHGLPL